MAEHDSGRLRGILNETALALSEAVGRTAVEASVEVALEDLEGLSLEEASAELPEELREALDVESLGAATETCTAWQPLWEALSEGIRRFQAGRRHAIAITGPRGSGRGALLDRVALLAAPTELEVTRFSVADNSVMAGSFLDALAQALELEGPQSGAEVERYLLEGPRRMIVVERAHHLYMRRIGGFIALREGLTVLASTLPNVLWVWEVAGFAWEYLDEIHQLRSYFDQVVTSPLLDEEDLRELFQRQLAGDRFQLQFLAPKDLDATARQEWESQGFYRRLHQVSRGNLEAAGILFLRSTRWSASLGRALVLPVPMIPFEEVLATYPRTALLGLAMLVEHEVLTRGELEDLLLIAPGHSQTILDTFARQNIVSRVEGGYQVNAPWLEPVHEYLGKWNIL